MALCVPSQAQTRQEGPRVGEIVPDIIPGDNEKRRVDTHSFLGKRSQFWIIPGSRTSPKADSEVPHAAQTAVNRGIATIVMADPGGKVWPTPFQTSYSTANVAFVYFYGTRKFVAIDKAGWLRDVEPLPSATVDPDSFALRFLLERTPDPTPAFEIGKPAPDFCMPDADGVWRRLSSLRGRKNLVLTFFPRCFTGKCKSHLSSLRDSFGAFQLADTEVWAVSVDPAAGDTGQKAFSDSLQLPFPLLPDVGRNLCFLYGAVETPTDLAKRMSVLVDKDGIVRFIDRDVAPETHGEDLLAHLKELKMTP